jgi:hypothetical protein
MASAWNFVFLLAELSIISSDEAEGAIMLPRIVDKGSHLLVRVQ